MTATQHRGAAMAALVLSLLAAPAAAQDGTATQDETGTTGAEDVREEISDTMQAIADFSAEQRDEAVAMGREALDWADAELSSLEDNLRDSWSEMGEDARQSARMRLEDLREARNELGERYGALQAAAASAWEDVRAGFTQAWNDFAAAWMAAEEDEAME